jgi:very-short-patch-repair endonuclease
MQTPHAARIKRSHLGDVPVICLANQAEGAYNAIMPAKRSNPKTMHRAGELRKEPTPAERKLWSVLRGNKISGVSFRRHTCPGGRCQGHAIGNYVPDFVSIKQKLVIELDGSQHLEQEDYDTERTQYFESLGYKVIRFWNNWVMNDIEGVIQVIQNALGEK